MRFKTEPEHIYLWLIIKVFLQVLLFPVVARLQPGVQGADDGQDWGLHPLLQHARGPQPGQVQPRNHFII